MSKLHSERNKVISQIGEHSPRKNQNKYNKITFNGNSREGRSNEKQMLKNFSFVNNIDLYEKQDNGNVRRTPEYTDSKYPIVTDFNYGSSNKNYYYDVRQNSRERVGSKRGDVDLNKVPIYEKVNSYVKNQSSKHKEIHQHYKKMHVKDQYSDDDYLQKVLYERDIFKNYFEE